MIHRAPQAYGEASYWDNRYQKETRTFDWYQQYSGLAPLVHKYVPKTSLLLMVGCGNSVLSEDMVNDGYQDIVNIDISSVVIKAMQKKYKEFSQLKYLAMDVRDMKIFEDAQFDAIVDKGTLDSLMCGENAHSSVAKMLGEVHRVLKPGGVYILVTYGSSRLRVPHLKASEINWTIALHVLPKPGSQKEAERSSWDVLAPIQMMEDGTLVCDFAEDDCDLHYIYVCMKAEGNAKSSSKGNKQAKGK